MNLKNLLPNKNILIIDVESTCTDDKSIQFTNEIIEIGIAQLESNGNIVSIPSIFIKPENSDITPFCTKLTTLTKQFINKNGVSPEEGYTKLNNVAKNFSVWASYGEYDKKMFEKMSSLYGIKINLPKKHINIRLVTAQKIANSNDSHDAPNNPKDSLEKLKIKFIGTNHRGDDDAKNIALLYKHLINYKDNTEGH